jgi:hypothetical protein
VVLSGPGGATAFLSSYSLTGTVTLWGTVYYVASESSGATIAYLRLSAPSLAHGIAGQAVPVDLVDEDSGEFRTGIAAPTVRISKNGGTWAAPSDGTWAEVGYGLYTVTLDDEDTSDLGWIMIRITASGIIEVHVLVEVSINPAERRADYTRGRVMHRSR